jgi:hypothetical protein
MTCNGADCTSRPASTTSSNPATRPSAPVAKLALGFEFGYGRPADATNIYGNGLGKTLVIGIRGFEGRFFEYYDLEDKTGTYDGARGAQGTLGISSLGYRFHVAAAGPVRIGVLVGGAWLRRPSLLYDVNDPLGSDGFERRTQNGIGVLAGGGAELRLGPVVLGVDARIYPTKWASMEGMRASVPGPIETITSTPGGIPVTVNAWISFVVL